MAATENPTIKNIYGKHYSVVDTDIFSMIPHFFHEFNNDPEVLVIYAGPSKQYFPGLDAVKTSMMRADIKRSVNEKTRLCFEDIHEGATGTSLLKIHEIIKDLIPANQVYYFTGALNADDSYSELCERFGITEKIHINTCSSWEHHLKINSQIKRESYTIKTKEKNFLCFNRIRRSHRLALLGMISNRNILENCFYSYMNADYGKGATMSAADIKSSINDPDVQAEIVNGLSKISIPLKLNIEPDDNINFVRADDGIYFDESYLSIVTETFFYPVDNRWGDKIVQDLDAIFFSEKIFKPILMQHPFMVVSVKGSLAFLRKLGYKTFSPFIDETYDDIEDNTTRLKYIADEIERLNKKTSSEWIEWQNNIKTIVDHNYSILTNKKRPEFAVSRS